MPFCLVLLLKAFGGAVIYDDQACFGSPLSETQQGDSKKNLSPENLQRSKGGAGDLSL